MMYEKDTVRLLYRSLLRLYPRGFRAELGESMVQTFNDLYHEKQQTKKGWSGLVVWVFVETAIAIIQEWVLLIKEMNPVKNILTNLRVPAVISFLTVLPFMIMEVVNTQNFNAMLNVPLFGIMWFLPMIFIITLIPMVHTVRAGNRLIATPFSFLIRVALLLFIAWLWGNIVIDQMPCFLGVPNCD